MCFSSLVRTLAVNSVSDFFSESEAYCQSDSAEEAKSEPQAHYIVIVGVCFVFILSLFIAFICGHL